MTHRYIGTKVVTAWPNDWATPVPEDDPRYNRDHFTQQVAKGYAVKYEDGYTSWSPYEAFAKAYRLAEGPLQALTFGDALHFLKHGSAVARTGWNGKGMYVFLIGADTWELTTATDKAPLMSFLALRTADGKVVPWLASQTDMLAEDWMVL